MRKYISAFLMLLIVLLLCSCGNVPEKETVSTESSESETEAESPAAGQPEETEPEIFTVSLVTDSNALPSGIEPSDEFETFKVISAEEAKMTGETYEIWEKYIAPIESGMPLALDFDENNAPSGNIAIYTYIFYQCENLDNKYYGIEKSGFDMSENYFVDGRKTEESIGRWFPWDPEDYRRYFEYIPETDQYKIPGCGGGYTYSCVRDYSFEGDILTIDFSIYDGWGEGEYLEVFSNHTMKIKIEEKGWKYLSNKKTYEKSLYSPRWHNSDFSAFAHFTTPKMSSESSFNYVIFNKNQYYSVDIGNPFGHKMYFGEKPYCFFLTASGLYFYRFETNEFIRISEVPSEYNKTHYIRTAWVDSDGYIIISYNAVISDLSKAAVEIAVLDSETYEIINYINTGLPADYFEEIPFEIQHEILEEKFVEIYDTETEQLKKIKYLE